MHTLTQTEKQTERQIERQTDTNTNTHTHTHARTHARTPARIHIHTRTLVEIKKAEVTAEGKTGSEYIHTIV